MITTARRIGVVIPSPNTVLEPDIISQLPAGTTAHFARVGLSSLLSVELLESMSRELTLECRKLALAGVSALGYGCTSGSFFAYEGFDLQMVSAMTEASGGIPATTATTAALAVLRGMKARRIVFLSPYEESMHQKGVQYFSNQGFEVASNGCLGFMEEADIIAVTYEQIARLVKDTACPDADAVFISCTGLPVTQYLKELSTAAGMPVLSSSQVLSRHLIQIGETR